MKKLQAAVATGDWHRTLYTDYGPHAMIDALPDIIEMIEAAKNYSDVHGADEASNYEARVCAAVERLAPDESEEDIIGDREMFERFVGGSSGSGDSTVYTRDR